MENYNYLTELANDITDYIQCNFDKQEIENRMNNREQFAEELNEILWIEDSVTGNASGSYTFNSEQAKEYVVPNIDILIDVCNELCVDLSHALKEGYEYCDVTIRCGLLSQAIELALDEIENTL